MLVTFSLQVSSTWWYLKHYGRWKNNIAYQPFCKLFGGSRKIDLSVSWLLPSFFTENAVVIFDRTRVRSTFQLDRFAFSLAECLVGWFLVCLFRYNLRLPGPIWMKFRTSAYEIKACQCLKFGLPELSGTEFVVSTFQSPIYETLFHFIIISTLVCIISTQIILSNRRCCFGSDDNYYATLFFILSQGRYV